jgi:hypothetical protein
VWWIEILSMWSYSYTPSHLNEYVMLDMQFLTLADIKETSKNTYLHLQFSVY